MIARPSAPRSWPTEVVISLVDAYRTDHGVEPVRKVLPIAPSTHSAHIHRREHPEAAPARCLPSPV